MGNVLNLGLLNYVFVFGGVAVILGVLAAYSFLAVTKISSADICYYKFLEFF